MKKHFDRLLLFSLVTTALSLPSSGGDLAVLTNITDVISAIRDKHYGRRFELIATITLHGTPEGPTASFPLSDTTGHLILRSNKPRDLGDIRSGDTVRAHGFIDISHFLPGCARVTDLRRLAPGQAPKPKPATGDEIVSGTFDDQLVTITGIVRDAFFDDIDPDYCALILHAEKRKVNVLLSSAGLDAEKLQTLINARIAVSGFCLAHSVGARRMTGRHLYASGIDAIRIVDQARDSLFDVQNLEDLKDSPGEDISRLSRRRVFGKVLAVWGGNNFLVRYAVKDIVRIELTQGGPPAYGDYIEAVGFPETDLYFVNLTRAVWRPHEQPDIGTDQPPQPVSPAALLTDAKGRNRVSVRFHGQPVSLRGTVRSTPSPHAEDGRIVISCDGINVPVDVSAHPEFADRLTVGCEIVVAGTCVMDIENWRPNLIFPRIKGFFVVPRIPSDITVVSRPSWWTPTRLAIALGTLFTLLVGILFWNTSLRRKVEKRSRELTRETVARVTSELKVGERTRLAMELHDSIVQNLTGVSMEIRTADRVSDEDRAGMHQHLDLAVKTLDSCRKDLRNCLWDLRNLTLEDEDVNAAIRRTLAPHVGSTKLSVRFNVPRDLFCENTAHTILRIIRELAINAVQHGHATSLAIAGSIEGDKLLFSVKDNGCGFDPKSAPGMAQGHFGLQGIRDRIETFDGEMGVESAADKGTKVTISLNLPKDEEHAAS